MLETVVIPAKAEHRYTVIWLHGLGADGHDFEPLVAQLQLPTATHIKWIFPHAPIRPITLNGGMRMRGWYDIFSLDFRHFVHDKTGILSSAQAITHLIEAEINHGIPAKNIVLAGFSQGGAIALATTLLLPKALAHTLALSTYLPTLEEIESYATVESRKTPISQFHGRNDPIIPLSFGQKSSQKLQALGYQVAWFEYAMDHGLCTEELNDLQTLLTRACHHFIP